MDLEVENVLADSLAGLGFVLLPLPVIILCAWNNIEELGVKNKYLKKVVFRLLGGYLISGTVFFIFTITFSRRLD